MSHLQANNITNGVKQLQVRLRGWFEGLPAYQKILTCVATATSSLLGHYLYCKLNRKLNNYPPGFIR